MSIRKLKSRGIGRLELLAWINAFLETDYTKLEHLNDAIAYCQVLDAVHPGKLPLQAVNFQPKSRLDYEHNWQIFRRALNACGESTDIAVKRLVDGVFQEHFELLHWLHSYVYRVYPDAIFSYQGFEKRKQVLGSTHQGINIHNLNLIPSGEIKRPNANATSFDPSMPEGDSNKIEGREIAKRGVLDSAPLDPVETKEVSNQSFRSHIHLVSHSYNCTMHAKAIVEKAEIWLERAKDSAKQMEKDDKQCASKLRGTVQSHRTKGLKRSSSLNPAQLLLQRHLAELFEVLQGELNGRVDDLIELQKEVDIIAHSLDPVECSVNK